MGPVDAQSLKRVFEEMGSVETRSVEERDEEGAEAVEDVKSEGERVKEDSIGVPAELAVCEANVLTLVDDGGAEGWMESVAKSQTSERPSPVHALFLVGADDRSTIIVHLDARLLLQQSATDGLGLLRARSICSCSETAVSLAQFVLSVSLMD